MAQSMAIVLDLDQQAFLFKVSHQVAAALVTVLASVWSRLFVHVGIVGEHVNGCQAVALPNFVIGRVVGRGDFDRPGAELGVHRRIGDDGDASPQGRQDGLPSHQRFVARVVGVHSHRCVAQDRLRSRGGHLDVLCSPFGPPTTAPLAASHLPLFIYQRITHVPQLGGLFLVNNLQVRDSCLTTGAPVDQIGPPVDQALLIELNESHAHSLGKSLIQGETFAIPIAGDAQAAVLLGDDAAVLLFPLPHSFHKLLASQVMAGQPLFGQFPFYHILGSDTSVVRARHPEGGIASHAMVADHQVFYRGRDGVAQMQLASHIGRRHGDDEGLLSPVGQPFLELRLRLEIPLGFPPIVEPLFGGMGVVGFGHFLLTHVHRPFQRRFILVWTYRCRQHRKPVLLFRFLTVRQVAHPLLHQARAG